MKTEDVARRLNVDEKTVQRWARDGVLPAVRLGGTVRFDRAEIEKTITAAAPPPSRPTAITGDGVRLEEDTE